MEKDIVLPDGFISALTRMPDDQFRSFVHRHRPDLVSIWRDGSIESARRVLGDLCHELDEIQGLSTSKTRRSVRVTRIGMVIASVSATAATTAASGAGAIVTIASSSIAGQVVNTLVDWVQSAPERRTVKRVLTFLRSRPDRSVRMRERDFR